MMSSINFVYKISVLMHQIKILHLSCLSKTIAWVLPKVLAAVVPTGGNVNESEWSNFINEENNYVTSSQTISTPSMPISPKLDAQSFDRCFRNIANFMQLNCHNQSKF